MARIRSVHPGLFTDESFMAASLPARMLLIGIWTEAWDDGVFEWKPLTLRARIFPVDNLPVQDLLEELVQLDFLRKFEANGKPYGLLRNFGKWQRPKKPNSSGVLPDDMRAYCGISAQSSEPIPHQSGTSGEKSPQMEDGGGRMEEGAALLNPDGLSGGSSPPPPEKVSEKEIERRLEQATGWRGLRNIAPVVQAVHGGLDLEGRLLPLARSVAAEFKNQAREPPQLWSYLLAPANDAERQAKPCAREVEMIFVPEGSPYWSAIIKSGKKESFLREMLKRAGDGTQGIYWAKSDLPALQSTGAEK